MKKIALMSLALALASCSSKPLQKADLEYKVFPKVASFKYEFNVAIPQVVDARTEDFVLGNDNYFAKPVTKALSNIIFEEIRSTNSFNTVALLDQSISFNPTSTQIQEIRRSVGKDAIFLAQINKFNANIRKLSDTDTSTFVNLKVFTNITYKLILADSETVIFLTTKDTSSDKTIPLDENVYKVINELAVNNIKNNIVSAKNDFILTTKGTVSGEDAVAKQKVKKLKVEKEFNLAEENKKKAEAEAAAKAAEELAKAEADKKLKEEQLQPKLQDSSKLAEQTTAEDAEKLANEQQPTEEVKPVEETQAVEQQAQQEAPVETTEQTAPAVEEKLVQEEQVIETTPEEVIEQAPVETTTVETAEQITKEITAEAENVVETVEKTVEVVEKKTVATAEKAKVTLSDFTETTR